MIVLLMICIKIFNTVIQKKGEEVSGEECADCGIEEDAGGGRNGLPVFLFLESKESAI